VSGLVGFAFETKNPLDNGRNRVLVIALNCALRLVNIVFPGLTFKLWKFDRLYQVFLALQDRASTCLRFNLRFSLALELV